MDRDEIALVVALAGCSLATTPGKDNWVDQGGGLPEYICEIARAVKRSGKSTSQAIAIAVSRCKKWAAGGDSVDADTRAKAAKAVAEWEKLKAKSKGKTAALSVRDEGPRAGSEYLILSAVSSWSMDRVRGEWDVLEKERRRANREARASLMAADPMAAVPDEYGFYRYAREVWTDFLIVEKEGRGRGEFIKVPYTVTTAGISFGEEIPVMQVYEDVPAGAEVSPTCDSCSGATALSRVVRAAHAHPVATG